MTVTEPPWPVTWTFGRGKPLSRPNAEATQESVMPDTSTRRVTIFILIAGAGSCLVAAILVGHALRSGPSAEEKRVEEPMPAPNSGPHALREGMSWTIHELAVHLRTTGAVTADDTKFSAPTSDSAVVEFINAGETVLHVVRCDSWRTANARAIDRLAELCFPWGHFVISGQKEAVTAARRVLRG